MDRGSLLIAFREYGILLVVAGVGFVTLMYGIYHAVKPTPSSVEILPSDAVAAQPEATQSIVVDVSGAVEKPGLYHLDASSRIGDAVVIAGGLSAAADRPWVAQYVNLAQHVEDGAKIYIPPVTTQSVAAHSSVPVVAFVGSSKININTASVNELDSLWGIGEARANDIIANRPYGSLDELVSKSKVPKNVFEKIKDQISIY